jgi:predicted  nucleic acid-binding Zn-ribbon protein
MNPSEMSALLQNLTTAVQGAEDAERRVADAQKRVNELDKEIATKTATVTTISHNLTSHQTRLDTKVHELAQAGLALDEVRKQRQQEEGRITSIRAAIAELVARVRQLGA